MNIPAPTHLKHRPVVLLPYDEHDGIYAKKTDCKFLSVGWAQWDPRTLSAKILRHTGERWSRQSEEMPLHRILDVALLIASTVEQTEDSRTVRLEAGMLEQQNDPKELPIQVENDFDRAEFERKLNDLLVRRRLRKLADKLSDLRSAGKI